MKNTLAILFFLCINFFSFSQSKFSLHFSGGSLAIKKDFGVNFDFGVGYKISNKIQLNAETLISELNKNEYELKYNLEKYSINVNYNFLPENNFSISSICGFSYINFDKKLILDKNDGIGVDLGINFGFNQNKNFCYGFKLVSTYNSIANGGILQSNLFFIYNL
jgi:hypothetical protein